MTNQTSHTEFALKAENLSIGYRQGGHEKIVASGMNLILQKGVVTCLLGPNGAGKSTLLRTLSCRQSALKGALFTGEGLSLSSMAVRDVARIMSVVYTERTNAGALTAREVVELGRQPYTGFFGRLSAEDHHIVAKSLEAVGMVALSDRFMATLSDGERQKVMIARALAQRTPVMILDEPTSFLDVASRLEIMQLLKMLADDYDTAVLLSTHDVASALAVSSQLWLMPGGGRFESGTPNELIQSGSLQNLFEGRGVEFCEEAMDFRLPGEKKLR